MVGDPIADQAALRAADISIGCPSSLNKPASPAEEDAPVDPLRAELLRGPNADEPAAEIEPLLPPEDVAYFESQTLRNHARSADFTPDITLDEAGLPSLVALWDTSSAVRARAKQNCWLSILFLLLFTPAAAGILTLTGGTILPYYFVGTALVVLLVFLIVNTLRE